MVVMLHLKKGISFINEPTDMPVWGMGVVHLRDPGDNLIFYIFCCTVL